MAGTLTFELRIAHIFQRKFDSESLRTALSDCHLYIISRRPSVRINKSSVRLHLDRVSLKVRTRSSIKSPTEEYLLEAPLVESNMISDFRTYASDSYFSLRLGEALIHGDAWALASMISDAREDLARQEVMYIGKAFGKDGNADVSKRTSRHQKLQKIYEDHAGQDWDIFVSALRIVELNRSNDDHINDDEPGTLGLLGGYYGVFQDRESLALLSTSIDLVEHGLISHFNPPYNDMLNEWKVDAPSLAMQKMRDAGFRLLRVHLGGHGSLVRYYSREVRKPQRSHIILHDFPPTPRRPVLRGISAEDRNNWRARLHLVHEPEAIMTAADSTALVLRIFGEEAPKVRTPTEALEEIEEQERPRIGDHQTLARLSQDALMFRGPSYDPVTGLVETGIYADGTKSYWQLNEPGKGLRHGIIVGAPGTGKTNHLNVITISAAWSGLFVLFLADPSGRHKLRDAWGKGPYIFDDEHSVVMMLEGLDAEVQRRNKIGGYESPRQGTPGILVTIEDAHLVWSTSERAVRCAERIAMHGPQSGVGMVVTIPDGNIQRFGGSRSLREALIRFGTRAAYGRADVIEMLEEFKYNDSRHDA